MARISVDAHVLIWGIKRQASANRAHLIGWAAEFFKACAARRDTLILPAPALAEALVGYSQAKRDESLAEIARSFFIAPLDAHAASIAASLYDKSMVDQLIAEHGVTRQCIKADIYVIACSVAAKATHLISHDRHVKKLARGLVIVDELTSPVVAPSQPPPEQHKANQRNKGLFDDIDG
jgi:hypothetical protein